MQAYVTQVCSSVSGQPSPRGAGDLLEMRTRDSACEHGPCGDGGGCVAKGQPLPGLNALPSRWRLSFVARWLGLGLGLGSGKGSGKGTR